MKIITQIHFYVKLLSWDAQVQILIYFQQPLPVVSPLAHHLEELLPKGPAHAAVDDEVDAGVDHHGQVGHAEEEVEHHWHVEPKFEILSSVV